MFLEDYKFIDLTHLLCPTAPTWTGSCGFCLEIKKDYEKIFRVQQVKMHGGIGTHMDAPSHRFKGKNSIAEIPLERLIVPTCVINVSHKAHADYEISLEDIKEYELNHGKIPSNALVIGYTGWCKFWPDSSAYRNLDADGKMHFPAFSAQAAELLVDRNIAGIAIDTLSPDCGDLTFPVHQLLLGSGKYIIENIADCSSMPPKGAYVIVLPLKGEEMTESPTRILGVIPIS